MIELVFVVLIVSILAAIAMPRINSVKDDTEAAKVASNLNTLIKDVKQFYHLQYDFVSNYNDLSIKDVTDVILAPAAGSDKPSTFYSIGTIIQMSDMVIKSSGLECIGINIVMTKDPMSGEVSHIQVFKAKDKDKALCKAIYKEGAIASILNAGFSYKAFAYTDDNGVSVYQTINMRDGVGDMGFIPLD